MVEQVLIWGAGAIGGTIGAALHDAGCAVTFVDTEPAHTAAIRDPHQGLTIEGPVEQQLLELLCRAGRRRAVLVACHTV